MMDRKDKGDNNEENNSILVIDCFCYGNSRH